MPAGRPPTYKDAEELQAAIDKYIENPPTRLVTIGSEKVEVPCYTITGLAYYLGFADRVSFYDYENKPEFAYTIKRARAFIENEYEKMLFGNNVAGPIFALKNFGWKDKTEQDITTNGKELATQIVFTAKE